MKTRTRSILSVVAGLVGIIVASSAVDAVLHATGVYPPVGEDMSDGLFAVAFGYRLAISIAGCWLTARLAPARPLAHALVLGGIGVALASLGAAVMWSHGHHWYPLALVASSVPCAWLGGKLALRPLRQRAVVAAAVGVDRVPVVALLAGDRVD